MKLIIHDTLNSQSERNGRRTVHVDAINGVISISRCGAKMCKLEEGNKIVLASDAENPKEWFFAKTDSETGFTLKRLKHVLKFNNKVVAKKLMSSLKLDGTATFLISKTPQVFDGVEYYPLITSRPVSEAPRKFVRNNK